MRGDFSHREIPPYVKGLAASATAPLAGEDKGGVAPEGAGF